MKKFQNKGLWLILGLILFPGLVLAEGEKPSSGCVFEGGGLCFTAGFGAVSHKKLNGENHDFAFRVVGVFHEGFLDTNKTRLGFMVAPSSEGSQVVDAAGIGVAWAFGGKKTEGFYVLHFGGLIKILDDPNSEDPAARGGAYLLVSRSF